MPLLCQTTERAADTFHLSSHHNLSIHHLWILPQWRVYQMTLHISRYPCPQLASSRHNSEAVEIPLDQTWWTQDCGTRLQEVVGTRRFLASMLSWAMIVRIWPKTCIYLNTPENQPITLFFSLMIQLTQSALPDKMGIGMLAAWYLVFLLGRNDMRCEWSNSSSRCDTLCNSWTPIFDVLHCSWYISPGDEMRRDMMGDGIGEVDFEKVFEVVGGRY